VKAEYGWTGKILRVDLTERNWSVESTEKYAERFIGGIGIGLKILWDEINTDVGALDPENKLIFAPGPLTGTFAPGSGRFELVGKSPRSYPEETITRSGMGGFWGPELKFAGYDALIVQGKASGWVNLWICNDKVEFKEAKEYLGEDTYTTQMRLRDQLDPQAKILCIGPAGEKLSRLAVILSETSFTSGKSGFGAVMGSKNLKAIAVRGTKSLRVFNSVQLLEISKKVRQICANNPVRDWTARGLDLRNYFRYRKKNTGCFNCPVQCYAFLDVPDAGASAAHCTAYFYFTKATEYYGESLERDQAVTDCFVLANRLGLDTFEIRRMIEFIEDLYKAGNIKSQPGLDLDRIGSREFIRELIFSIASRDGIGDVLAEGSARAADQFKDGWEFCSKHFPAYGSAEHESVRKYPGVALLWALDSRDPISDHHAYVRISAWYPNQPPPYKLPVERAKAISQKFFGSEMAIDHSTFKYKPEAVIYCQNRSAVNNTLVLCDWVYPMLSSLNKEDYMGDTSLECQLLAAVTGYSLNERELDQAGERVLNLARAIMVREGRTRDEDTLHESYFDVRDGETSINKSDFEQAKTIYYKLRGWDEKTGWPTKEKLVQLNLSDIANDLEKEKPL
jgi:aldehyde:ferredoxin oxidoreductase